jgi:hypothetical protein
VKKSKQNIKEYIWGLLAVFFIYILFVFMDPLGAILREKNDEEKTIICQLYFRSDDEVKVIQKKLEEKLGIKYSGILKRGVGRICKHEIIFKLRD